MGLGSSGARRFKYWHNTKWEPWDKNHACLTASKSTSPAPRPEDDLADKLSLRMSALLFFGRTSHGAEWPANRQEKSCLMDSFLKRVGQGHY